MQRPSDELLVAFLDGELDETQRTEIAAWLDQDAETRDLAGKLAETAVLLHAAYDDVMHEPLPARLIAAARGSAVAESSNVVAFPPRSRFKTLITDKRWWTGVAMAAAVSGLVIGGGVGYFANNEPGKMAEAKIAEVEQQLQQAQSNVALASGSWLDNIAGYHKMLVTAGSDDAGLVDVPGDDSKDPRKGNQKLPSDIRVPNLKPWDLTYQGGRKLIVEGRPAMQLYYTTGNKSLGPLTLVIGSSNRPDSNATLDHRDDVNVVYWRHQGHSYAIVGTASIGYLWNLYKDIAYQLNNI